MYGWTNNDGEPIMDGAAYRFEQSLDFQSAQERFYDMDDNDYWDNEPDDNEWIDPDVCEHKGDKSFPQGAGMKCDDCLETYEGPCLIEGPLDFPVFLSRDLNRY